MWTCGDHKVLKPGAESCVPRACRGLPLTQSDVSAFVTPHSNYTNIINACLGHRKLLHQKEIRSTAARKGILVRLIPIFWVIVGRKKYEEKKVLGPSDSAQAVLSDTMLALLCSVTHSSVMLSFSRKEKCHVDTGTQTSLPAALDFCLDWPMSKKVEVLAESCPSCGSQKNFPWWSFWWTSISGAKAEAFLSVGQILSACAFWNWYSLDKSKQ